MSESCHECGGKHDPVDRTTCWANKQRFLNRTEPTPLAQKPASESSYRQHATLELMAAMVESLCGSGKFNWNQMAYEAAYAADALIAELEKK